MFFTWAIKTRCRWLPKVIYWAQVPVVVAPVFGLMYVWMGLTRWLTSISGNFWLAKGVSFISPLLLFCVAVGLCIFLMEKLFRYRTSNLMVASLAFCPEDVSVPHFTFRRGAPIVELHMGEFYNYAKYWPLRLTLSELIPFAFLDTYTGVLKLIEQVKSGASPINRDTVLMTTTIFLTATTHLAPIYVAEEVRRKKTLLHRLAMALSLRTNPFSSRIPPPRSGSKRIYFPAQAFVDSESFFREEIARLSTLTQKILERKQRRQKSMSSRGNEPMER